MGRAVCVFLCAASINDASKKPLEILRSVPTKNWTIEVERFTEQVRSENIALTGSNFYFMTRKLLFGVKTFMIFSKFRNLLLFFF